MDATQAARNLGWLSFALGAGELFMPRVVGRLMGIGDRVGLLRLLGAREFASGATILAQDKPTAGVWSRVVGDVMDVALVAAALPTAGRKRRNRVAGTLGFLLAIGVLDVVRARQLSRQ